MLARGDRGPLVSALQRTLSRAGHTLPVTGWFGPATERAWRDFAAASRLHPTISTETLTRLGVDTLAAATWTPISRSSSRSRIRTLQRALTQAGYPLVVDGRLGPRTQAAYHAWLEAAFGLQPQAPLPPVVVDEPAAVALGLFTPPPPQERFAAFPLQAPCFFASTFGHPRPPDRTHEGVDLIAAELTPVLAPFPGVIRRLRPDTGSISGNSLRIEAVSQAHLAGSYVFFAHLHSFAPGLADGTPVSAGQVVGFLGHTGTHTPHLHLEWHPAGGRPVDPFPLLVRSGSCTP